MALRAQLCSLEQQEMSFLASLPQSFEKGALSLGDKILLEPFSGNRRTIELKRTGYDFVTGEGFNLEKLSTIRILPALESDYGQRLSLKLKPFLCRSNNKIKHAFEVSSSNPFRLNGQWVSRAFLCRGDIVDFALTRLHFSPSAVSKLKRVNIPKAIMLSNLPILIEGETGTGKSTLAYEVHKQSGVAGRFVHLNLAAFSPALIESELFGHIKGAFTGAMKEKSGAFYEASNGTLFLDEIDSLSKELQTKLLLFLDDGIIRAVGANHTKKVSTRVIAASGSSLLQKVDEGTMRSDFYHRLASGVKIVIPSLREDPETIECIVETFSSEMNRAICPELIQAYKKMDWPGNIRELRGHLHKKHILNSRGLIRWDEADEALLLMKTPMNQVCFGGEILSLRELKKNYVHLVLARYHFNYIHAARVLGLSVNTVRNIDQAARIDEI